MLNGVPRILIIRLSAIGDVVRVLPALHALRDLHPHAQIDWAVEPKSAGILEGHPALDRVLVFPRPDDAWSAATAFLRFCREIRRSRYDVVFDFHGIAKSGLIMGASLARKRVAFARPRSQEGSALFASQRVRLPAARMNRIEENLELVKAFGARRLNLEVEIEIPDAVQDEVDEYLTDKFHGGKRLVVLHAPVDRAEKQWPLTHFAGLADLLLADGRFEVLLTWAPGQRGVAEKVQALARRNPEIAPETPTLKHLAALLLRCDLFVGGDTGPMHIASAVNTPVVGLFGGTDPRMHSPLRPPCAVLYGGDTPPDKPIDRARGPELLARITPQQAWEAGLGLLKPDRRPAERSDGPDLSDRSDVSDRPSSD